MMRTEPSDGSLRFFVFAALLVVYRLGGGGDGAGVYLVGEKAEGLLIPKHITRSREGTGRAVTPVFRRVATHNSETSVLPGGR